MAKKTVLRRLIGTYGPMSMEMQNVLDADDDAETKIRRDIGSKHEHHRNDVRWCTLFEPEEA